MASANDYHIDEKGLLQGGLGSDEPSEEKKLAAKHAGAAAIAAQKEELNKLAGQLSETELALNAEKEALSKERAAFEAERLAFEKQRAETAAAGDSKKGGAR